MGTRVILAFVTLPPSYGDAGFRTNAAATDFAAILPEDLEATIKAAAEISMGTEISESDLSHIHALCDQVISISEYRAQLSEYLRNRMVAIAPNLTAIVGELVGARLISHAGSLLNLAKHPASSVRILSAEIRFPVHSNRVETQQDIQRTSCRSSTAQAEVQGSGYFLSRFDTHS